MTLIGLSIAEKEVEKLRISIQNRHEPHFLPQITYFCIRAEWQIILQFKILY